MTRRIPPKKTLSIYIDRHSARGKEKFADWSVQLMEIMVEVSCSCKIE